MTHRPATSTVMRLLDAFAPTDLILVSPSSSCGPSPSHDTQLPNSCRLLVSRGLARMLLKRLLQNCDLLFQGLVLRGTVLFLDVKHLFESLLRLLIFAVFWRVGCRRRLVMN